MSEFFLNIKCKKQFKDCEYEVKAQVPLHKNCLQFEIKSTIDPWVWRNEFTAQYIEDLTDKTGQKKTFFEFLNLVDDCFTNKASSKSSFDVLTYQDLKNMNSKKSDTSQLNSTGQSQMNSSSSTNDQSSVQQQRQNKRYLIVSTSNGTFEEKTHYPLSLNGEQINDPAALKDIIKGLQKELSKARNNEDGSGSNSSTFYSSNGFDKKQGSPRSTSGKSFYDQQGQKTPNVNKKEHDQLKVENELLKAKVKRIEDYFSQKQGAIEIEQLIKQKFNLENEVDKMRILSSKRICELEVEVEVKERQLNQKKAENLDLQKQLTQIVCESEDTANKRIKAQLLKLTEETEQQLVLSKKTIQKQKTEIDRLTADSEKHTNLEKGLRQKIAQLEIELTNSQRRSNSRSNPLGARGVYGTNHSSNSSINSRRSTPNNHISKLGYSSPSLQLQNRNRFNRTDGSQSKVSTPNGSKTNLTPKSQSYSSIRSNSMGSQNNTPTNPRFQRGVNGVNSLTNQRNNKFFSANPNNNNNNNNNSQNSSQNNSRNNSAGSNNSLNKNNSIQNRRQPLYQPSNNINNRQSSLNRVNQNQNNSQNNGKSGSFDPIPENGKYNQQAKQQGTPSQSSPSSSVVSRLYQPKTYNQPANPLINQRSSSTQRQSNTSNTRLNSSGNNANSLRIDPNASRKPLNTSYNSITPSSNLSTQSNMRTPQNPTQPRYVPANNYMKPLNKNSQPQKVGYQPNQLRQHTQIQEKIDQALFDDKHILNNQAQPEGKSELEMKIDKLQNILQSAKDMTVDDF